MDENKDELENTEIEYEKLKGVSKTKTNGSGGNVQLFGRASCILVCVFCFIVDIWWSCLKMMHDMLSYSFMSMKDYIISQYTC